MPNTDHRAWFTKHTTAHFHADATAGFEEVMLKNNADGFRLDKWVVDEDGIFHLVLTALKEVQVIAGKEVVGTSYEVAPWQVFIMRHASRMILSDGREFSIVRLPAEYSGMDAGDPVVLTDIKDCSTLAECTLTSLKRIKIRALTVDDLLCMSASMRAFSKDKLIRFLRGHYQTDHIDEDTTVSVLNLRVDKGSGRMSLLNKCGLMRKHFLVKFHNGGLF